MNQERFDKIIQEIKTKKLNVESIIITQNDVEYKNLFTIEFLKNIRSISKTITCLALGIAIDKGFFKQGINTYIMDYFKEIDIDNKNNLEKLVKLQIKHLITFTGGYDKQVLNKKHIRTLKDDINLLKAALNYPLVYDPGEKFVFSNASIYLLSIIIDKEIGKSLYDFVNQEMMKKMEIDHFEWDKSREGYTFGATGLKILPSDFHKIAKMILDNGIYKGKQIISSQWLNEMKTLKYLSPEDYVEGRVLPKYGHGYNFWICPNEIYYHDGNGGQYMIFIQNKKMVITITSDDEENRHLITECIRDVIY